ncbi:MAG TPA: outer membrane protein assembly factor BamA [Vicinamibacterales bacterium]|nr:outer membrane protein assembly factor BamA [Vicinamibacterales bacterium]
MLNSRTCLLAVVFCAAAALPLAAQPPASPAPVPTLPQQPPQQPAAQNPAQVPALPAATGTLSICGYTIGPPAKLPPDGSPPVVYQVGPCFAQQGGASVIDPQTYIYYMQLKPSQPSQGIWVPWDEKAEDTALQDFKRLWATNFLDDLSVHVYDYVFSNGVVGKVVLYDMEERQRVKIVDYVGSKKVEQTKIEEELKNKGIQIRLDSFIDPGLVRRVAGVVRDLYAEKGYEFAEVKPVVTPVAGGPKLVHLSFNITEGPKVKIRDVEFIGNKDISDGKLAGKMKENKARGFLSFITGGGTYKEEKFAEDAQLVVDYYRERGYIMARVGQPELKVLEDSSDKKTRWVQLRIPVTEGERYRVGDFTFAGNKVVKSEGLRPLFKIESGEWYNEKKIRKGLDKARELYGSVGYFEFVGYPDLQPRDQADAGQPESNGDGTPQPDVKTAAAHAGPPVVDVTMRMEEGKQYFVNRITFAGNTTTRDNVIRREIRLFEGGVFNTEALKYSVRRLNQLGYFKTLEGDAIDVQKTPNTDNKVDVKLKFEEQNRNQVTFGAGVSQYEGFFGQLSFQTSNFMGRGETFSISAQQGDRAKNYQLAFTEPFLFDRPITAGADIFLQEIDYIGQFTQETAGANTVWGFPVADFSRIYLNYSYQKVRVKDLNPLYRDPIVLANNPYLRDSLLIGEGGERRISKIGPSFVFNTVDNPMFPTTGKRYTLSLDVAGLGGNAKFYNPRAEGIWYFQQNRRISLGFRAQVEYISPYGGTLQLPIFEKLFLGGEYSIRGYDIRSVGPRDPISGLVVGGNKSLLFNAEYLINIAGPVRLVLFYDAGQVQDRGSRMQWDDFKTSTGAEVRFFMPVLNVPFRLIFAANPQRSGVLDNQLRPERAFKFRFAVGTTF